MASRVNDSDGGGSLTPSEQSDGEERSEHDSDYETDDGEEEEDNSRQVDIVHFIVKLFSCMQCACMHQ